MGPAPGEGDLAQQYHHWGLLLQVDWHSCQWRTHRSLPAVVLVMATFGDSPGVHCQGLLPATPKRLGAVFRGRVRL